jgi:hypothetical protein
MNDNSLLSRIRQLLANREDMGRVVGPLETNIYIRNILGRPVRILLELLSPSTTNM